jgi:hypothetical protein
MNQDDDSRTQQLERHLAALRKSNPRRVQHHLQKVALLWNGYHGFCIRPAYPPIPATREGVEVVAKFVGHADQEVRLAAVVALAHGHAFADIVMPVLIRALDDSYVPVRLNASDQFTRGDLGELDRAAAPALQRLLHDPVREVRWRAASALAHVEPMPEIAAPLFDHLAVSEDVCDDYLVKSPREQIERAGLLKHEDRARLFCLLELGLSGTQSDKLDAEGGAGVIAERLSLIEGELAAAPLVELLIAHLAKTGDLHFARALGRCGPQIAERLAPLENASTQAKLGAWVALRRSKASPSSWPPLWIRIAKDAMDQPGAERLFLSEAFAFVIETEAMPLEELHSRVRSLPSGIQMQLVRELSRPIGYAVPVLERLSLGGAVAGFADEKLNDLRRKLRKS